MSGRFKEAVKALDKALETNPSWPGLWILKGQVLDEMGNHDAALEQYNKALLYSDDALKANQENVDNWLAKGDCLQKIGKIPEAESCYMNARQLDPKNYGVLNKLFMLYAEELCDYSKALEMSREVLKVLPDSFSAKANHSETLIKAEKYTEARKILNSLVDQAPDNVYECVIRYYIFLSYFL